MKNLKWLLLVLLSLLTFSVYAHNEEIQTNIANVVDAAVQPIMKKYQIPGMAIAVTVNGKDYYYNYGVSSEETKAEVTKQTLFEIGSVTKTFTAALATYLAQQNQLSMTSGVSQYMPNLKETRFRWITPINLLTHTSGLRVNLPIGVKTNEQLMAYLESWKPHYLPGTRRIYSNIGIGLMEPVIDHATGQPFQQLVMQDILLPLKMKDTFFNVPADEISNYSQGYDRKGNPIRLSQGLLSSAAYGLKSCSEDLIQYLQANMDELNIPNNLQRAINATHVSYYHTPYLVQDLGWEQYPFPASIESVERGNGATQLSAKASRIKNPEDIDAHVLVNKTGTTDGFSSYVLFVPDKKIGVVILANKVYPSSLRIKAGYQILAGLMHDFYGVDLAEEKNSHS